jgi:hypothetical protein
LPVAPHARCRSWSHQAARGSPPRSSSCPTEVSFSPGRATAASMEVLSDRHRTQAAGSRRERTRYVAGLGEGDLTDQARLPGPSATRLMPTCTTIASGLIQSPRITRAARRRRDVCGAYEFREATAFRVCQDSLLANPVFRGQGRKLGAVWPVGAGRSARTRANNRGADAIFVGRHVSAARVTARIFRRSP